MIGLDSNVLLRLFVDDDPGQSRRAKAFIAAHCSGENPGLVSGVTLCEVVWVLKKFYFFDRGGIAQAIRHLLSSGDIRIDHEQEAQAALALFSERPIDFADAFVAEINRARGCSATATFDRKAAKLAGFIRVP